MGARVSIAPLLLMFAHAWAADDLSAPLRYDKDSAFLRSRYETPISADQMELLTIQRVLALTGHEDDGKLLHQVVERKAVKRLLGEPYEPAGTVAQVIAREPKEREPIEALRTRALRALTVSPARSTGNETLTRDRRVLDYLGNSIWATPGLGTPERRAVRMEVYIRLLAKNSTSEPVQSFKLLLRQDASASGSRLDLECVPEKGDIPSKAAAVVICNDRPLDATALSMTKALKANRIKVSSGVVESMSVGGRTIEVHGVEFGGTYESKAAGQFFGASCAEKATCEQVEARNAAIAKAVAAREAAQRTPAESSMEERFRRLREADRQERQAKIEREGGKVTAGILAMLLLSAGAAFLTPRRTRSESTSIVVSFFTGLTLLASILAVRLFLFFTFGAGSFMLGLMTISILGPTLLISVLVLAAFMSGGEHATRFRVFVLVLGILTPIFFWVGLTSIR